jgi:hypothetical protein
VAAGRDFWAMNAQKVQHMGTSGDFILYENLFLSAAAAPKLALQD